MRDEKVWVIKGKVGGQIHGGAGGKFPAENIEILETMCVSPNETLCVSTDTCT